MADKTAPEGADALARRWLAVQARQRAKAADWHRDLTDRGQLALDFDAKEDRSDDKRVA